MQIRLKNLNSILTILNIKKLINYIILRIAQGNKNIKK